jgi:acyl-coenzyme A thioesterase PaaI-like protein
MPPFNNYLGLVVEEWREKHIKMSAKFKHKHLNYSHSSRGSFIATLLDATTALSWPIVMAQ